MSGFAYGYPVGMGARAAHRDDRRTFRDRSEAGRVLARELSGYRDTDGLLVIDQLDAVSTVSGRNPQFFHCFERLLL